MLACLSLAFAWALQIPPLTGPVVDQARVLRPNEVQVIASHIMQAHERGRVQLQVVTLPSLEGLAIEEVSIRIVDQWKLGDKKKDNGVLFLIVPSERKMRIEVGQGLEGELPDLRARQILDELVRPYFKAGDFGAGILAGVRGILQYVDGGEPVHVRRQLKSFNGYDLPMWVWVILFVIVILGVPFFGGGGRGGPGRGNRWLGGSGGSSGGWGSGGGWSGGGGGGWSGGGGGFSGGGSSGSW